jgi:uncharacterized membrane protein YbaN (DUF454 family)
VILLSLILGLIFGAIGVIGLFCVLIVSTVIYFWKKRFKTLSEGIFEIKKSFKSIFKERCNKEVTQRKRKSNIKNSVPKLAPNSNFSNL